MTATASLVVLRSAFFDEQMSEDHRREQLDAISAIAAVVAEIAQVRSTHVVDSTDSADSARAEISRQGPDVVVLVPLMAVPPAWAARAVPPSIPPLVWDIASGARMPATATQATAHRETSSVGLIMAAGGLAAEDRRYLAVSSPVAAGSEPLADAVRAASAAARLARTRLLALGSPVPGYSTVPSADAVLGALGIECAAPSEAELVAAFDRHRDAASDSERLSAAIRELSEQHQVDGLAVNCHGPFFRDNLRIGSVACLAVSESNDRGIAGACTGDTATAAALRLASLLAGAALYCEPYCVDEGRRAILLANCGVGSARLARTGTWRQLPSQHYPGVRGRGTSVAMAAAPGPASYLTVRPRADRWLVVVVEGSVSDDWLPEFGGAQAWFVPERLVAREVVVALAEAGVMHHGALTSGHLARSLRLLSRLIAIDVSVL
jgi:L-fucose isomerase-like protein